MIKIAPSILSADFANLERDIKMIEKAGADYVHVDVMDGHFVPNITIGAPVVAAIRKVTKLPLDVHLMISQPGRYIEDFAKAGADIITVHFEAEGDMSELIEKIKGFGVRASISVKPKTPVEELYPYLDKLDMALVMTVEPGFGGQGFIQETMDKIRALRNEIDSKNYNCELEIDGGANVSNIADICGAGARVVVAGSAVFKSEDPAATVAILKARGNEGASGGKTD